MVTRSTHTSVLSALGSSTGGHSWHSARTRRAAGRSAPDVASLQARGRARARLAVIAGQQRGAARIRRARRAVAGEAKHERVARRRVRHQPLQRRQQVRLRPHARCRARAARAASTPCCVHGSVSRAREGWRSFDAPLAMCQTSGAASGEAGSLRAGQGRVTRETLQGCGVGPGPDCAPWWAGTPHAAVHRAG